MNLPEDPFIRELLPEFVDQWLQDLDDQFQNYIDTKNADDLYRLAHTLKGSCFQFGMENVGNMGIELMGYAKAHDWQKAQVMLTPIRNSFVEVKEFIKLNPID